MCIQPLMMPTVEARPEQAADGCQLVDQEDVLQPELTWQCDGLAYAETACADKHPTRQIVPTSKLLVTWTPVVAEAAESSLRSLLRQYGDIQDLAILQPPLNSDGLGYATVTYASSKAAEAAVVALNKAPLQQKHAQLQAVMVKPIPQHSTLFNSLTASSRQSDDTAYLDSQDDSSSNSALQVVQQQKTAMQQQQQIAAEVAVCPTSTGCTSHGAQLSTDQTAIHESCRQLLVSGQEAKDQQQQQQQVAAADNRDDQQQQRETEVDLQRQQQQQQQQHTLFFAKVPRSASKAAVLELFSRHGNVVELDLFAESPDAAVSKGCGLVKFSQKEAAVAMLEQLGGKYTWHGMRSPMVLKLMHPDAHKQQQQQQQAQACSSSQRQHIGDNHKSSPTAAGTSMHTKHAHINAAAAAAAAAASPCLQDHQQYQQQQDHMPVGCARDAYKLFIGNVPKSYGTAALRKVFEVIGPVAEAVIIRDKITSESKGSAFVWYYTKRHADQAVEQFNMRFVLPTLFPDELLNSKPLVVRKASQHWRAHNAPASASAAATAAGLKSCVMGPAARAAGYCSLSNNSSGSNLYFMPTMQGDGSPSTSPAVAAAAAMLSPQLLQQGAAAAAGSVSPQLAAGLPGYQQLVALGANAHSGSISSRADLAAFQGQALPLNQAAAAVAAAAAMNGGSMQAQGMSQTTTAATSALLQQKLLQQMAAAAANPYLQQQQQQQQYGSTMQAQQPNSNAADLVNQLAALQLQQQQQHQMMTISPDTVAALPVDTNLTSLAAAGPSNAARYNLLTSLAATANVSAGGSAFNAHSGRSFSPFTSTDAAVSSVATMQAADSLNSLSTLSSNTNASSMHAGYLALDTVCPTAALGAHNAPQCMTSFGSDANRAAHLYGALCAQGNSQAAFTEQQQLLGLPTATQGLHLGCQM